MFAGMTADLQITRPQVRDRGPGKELNDALAGERGRADAAAMPCVATWQQHLLERFAALNVGQYVSLALYLSPPPALTPNVDETQLPPQATAGGERACPCCGPFAEATQLHVILFVRHRSEYEASGGSCTRARWKP